MAMKQILPSAAILLLSRIYCARYLLALCRRARYSSREVFDVSNSIGPIVSGRSHATDTRSFRPAIRFF